MNIIQQKVQSILMRQLTIMASNVVDDARKNASWSSTIPDAIELGSAQNDDGKIYIDITLNLKKAPQAAAFEYGSGLHRKDDPNTYEIHHRTKGKMLRIPASRWPNKKFDDDPAYLPYVNHPGVKARPYLRPAINKSRRSIRGIFLRAFKMGYIEAVPRVTIIEVKT